MARKTEEAEKGFQVAARLMRNNIPQTGGGTTAADQSLFIITRNQHEMAANIALMADAHAKMAASLRDIFDVVARIEAKQSGKPGVPGGGGRFPSTP